MAQLLKPSRTNKVQLLFAYNSLLVGKVVAIAKVTKFCHPYRVASGNFSLVSIAASLSSPAPTLIKLHSLLSLTGCPSAGIGLRLLAPWPPSSWSGSSRASSFGWPSDDSSAATTRWMRRSCWSHPAWPYWWMSCKYSRMFHPDMQIFDCWRSVRPVLFGPSVRRQSFPLGSFPIAIAAINLSRAWSTKWVNMVHPPNATRSQANCSIPGWHSLTYPPVVAATFSTF